MRLARLSSPVSALLVACLLLTCTRQWRGATAHGELPEAGAHSQKLAPGCDLSNSEALPPRAALKALFKQCTRLSFVGSTAPQLKKLTLTGPFGPGEPGHLHGKPVTPHPVVAGSTHGEAESVVELLDLTGCHIEQIGHGAFAALPSLRTLRLGSNDLFYGGPGAFSHDAFSELSHLQTLVLSGNAVRTVPTLALTPVAQTLEILRLDGNAIDGIEDDSFVGTFPRLTDLMLGANSIAYVQPLALGPGKFPALERLYLSSNNLKHPTALGVASLAHLPALSELHLWENSMPAVPTHALSHCDAPVVPAPLQWVADEAGVEAQGAAGSGTGSSGNPYYASGTVVPVFDIPPASPSVNTCLPALRVLRLDHNAIDALGDYAMPKLPSLYHLRLDVNNIGSITPQAFVGVPALGKLLLQENNLHQVPTLAMAPLTRLEGVWLDSNRRITHVDAGAFEELSALKWLTLTSCSISTLGIGAFQGLHSLLRLDLSDNDLPTLRPDTFLGLTSLAELRVRNNRIAKLVASQFGDAAPVLTSIDLGGNSIARVDVSTFEGVSSLQTLTLDGNNIRSIATSTFAPVAGTLLVLQLQGNPVGSVERGALTVLSVARAVQLPDNAFSADPAACEARGGVFATLPGGSSVCETAVDDGGATAAAAPGGAAAASSAPAAARADSATADVSRSATSGAIGGDDDEPASSGMLVPALQVCGALLLAGFMWRAWRRRRAPPVGARAFRLRGDGSFESGSPLKRIIP